MAADEDVPLTVRTVDDQGVGPTEPIVPAVAALERLLPCRRHRAVRGRREDVVGRFAIALRDKPDGHQLRRPAAEEVGAEIAVLVAQELHIVVAELRLDHVA